MKHEVKSDHTIRRLFRSEHGEWLEEHRKSAHTHTYSHQSTYTMSVTHVEDYEVLLFLPFVHVYRTGESRSR